MTVTINIEGARLANGEIPTATVQAQTVPRIEEWVEFTAGQGEISGTVQAVLHSFVEGNHKIYVRLR